MTMTKRKKRVLLIGIPAAVAVIAAAVVVAAMLLNRPETDQEDSRVRLVEAVSVDSDAGASYQVSGGRAGEEIQSALPCYSFTPPEGYITVLDAAQSANALSTDHVDLYTTNYDSDFCWYVPVDKNNFHSDYSDWLYESFGPGQEPEDRLRFSQEYAVEGKRITFSRDAEPYCLRTSDGEIVYAADAGSTEIYWIAGDSLLSLSTNQYLDQQEVLDWVSRVDTTPRTPEYSPLTLGRNEQMAQNPNTEDFEGYVEIYRAQGNSQLSDPLSLYAFSNLPEGFQPVTNQNLDYTATALECSKDTLYRNEDGDRLRVYQHAGNGELFHFDFNNTYQWYDVLAEEVTVNGNPGYYCVDGIDSMLAFAGDGLVVELEYRGDITKEELIALAESMVLQEVQWESETFSAPQS